MDEMGNLLVKTVKTKTTADYYYVAESTMVMPKLLLELTFKSGLNFSTLWKRITEEDSETGKKDSRKEICQEDCKEGFKEKMIIKFQP